MGEKNHPGLQALSQSRQLWVTLKVPSTKKSPVHPKVNAEIFLPHTSVTIWSGCLGQTQETVQKQMIQTYPEHLSLKYYEGIVVQRYNEKKKKKAAWL